MPDILPGPIFAPPPIYVRPGEALIAKDVFVYLCPLCGNQFRYDDPYEPMCTGPNLSLDEHAPEVMRLLRKETIRPMVFLSWQRD